VTHVFSFLFFFSLNFLPSFDHVYLHPTTSITNRDPCSSCYDLHSLSNSNIKAIQSDWGGEYRPISKLLQQLGILHRVSSPHTHQQNGAIERKHRHIVQTGLTLLSHAHLPLPFWDDALSTACYLINRMPTTILQINPHLKLSSNAVLITHF
jgi:transposase InsO family protein